MDFRVSMPSVLVEKGWALDLGDAAQPFRLKPGEKREVRLRLVPGSSFTADDLRAAGDQTIAVDLLGDGIELGGMRYAVDPDLKVRSGGPKDHCDDCQDPARHLLDCLGVGGGKVKKVRIRKVNLDIEFGHGHGCD